MLRTALLCLLTALPLASSAAPLNGLLTQRAVLNLDEGGQLMHFIRMDDTANSTVTVAQGKARHAVNYRRDTKFHQDILEKGNAVVLGLPDSVPVEGGIRLVANGKVIGAIGVAGVQALQDAQIARAGAALLQD